MKSPTFHYLVLATFDLSCRNGEVIHDHTKLYGPFKGRFAYAEAEALAVTLQRQGAWTRIMAAPEATTVDPSDLASIAPPSNPGTVRGLRGLMTPIGTVSLGGFTDRAIHGEFDAQ